MIMLGYEPNAYDANIPDSPSLPTFRRHLKTQYFQLAYHPLLNAP